MLSFQTGLINPQLGTGPIANAYFQAVQAEIGIPASGGVPLRHYAILEYFYNLSIDSANSFGILGSGELASIGQLIGFPWPSVFSAGFQGSFAFIPASAFPGSSPQTGFSSALSSQVNGTFISANPSQVGQYVPVPAYRQILKFIASVKWNGLLIPIIDTLLANIVKYLGYNVTNAYTINYTNTRNININFSASTANIGTGWLYVLQLIFSRVATVPTISLSIS